MHGWKVHEWKTREDTACRCGKSRRTYHVKPNIVLSLTRHVSQSTVRSHADAEGVQGMSTDSDV